MEALWLGRHRPGAPCHLCLAQTLRSCTYVRFICIDVHFSPDVQLCHLANMSCGGTSACRAPRVRTRRDGASNINAQSPYSLVLNFLTARASLLVPDR